ncbi:unnamed protein product [Urochloa decumbens]|uniref:Uncharacterized protein n=1 Tax=Urochloa decumbens TaxID=240449 RepID=A0ABC8WHP1_9POAL
MATRKMASRAKKRMVWTMMEATLVWKLPMAIKRDLAGIWKISPGESRMNSTNEMNTGAQSCIFFFNSGWPSPTAYSLSLSVKTADGKASSMAGWLSRFRV